MTPAATEIKTSAAAERNKEPIAQQLRLLLPPDAAVLEIASGTGQHVAHFAAALPASRWQPTDSNPDNLPLIQARIEGLSTLQLAAPVLLDVHQADWGLQQQQRNPAWGLRDLGTVTQRAVAHGLRLHNVQQMPANNLLVVFAA